MVFVAPGDLYLRLTTEKFGNADGKATGVAITDIDRTVTQTPVLIPNSVIDTTQRIQGMDLYINNIFVNPEINIIVSVY
jgi:hypothetical protein